MRNFMIAFVLSGVSSILVGCSEGESPSPVVSGKDAAEVKPDVAASVPETASDSPPKDLEEPVLPDEPSPTGELIIGDLAPPISIAKWVKGDAVEGFTKDKVYVVEFWATWCGPCLASMPHIASLQTEYGDKVTFIGVSDEEEDVVSGFMGQNAGSGKLWSEVLTYTIALDADRQTNAAYMQAAGQNGIPCAFIVGKSGTVEWIGHPAYIDQPLQQVIEGTWDITKARATFIAERESEDMMQEIGPKIQTAFQKGDFKTGVALIDQLIEKFPERGEFKQARFQFLLKGEMFDEANKAAADLRKASNDNAMELSQLAWILATGVPGPGPDLDLALDAAKRAEELTESKNASILDTLSRVLFTRGNIEDAIAIQKKAIDIAEPGEKEQYEGGLKEYEAALKGGDSEAKPSEAGEEKPVDSDEASPTDSGDVKPEGVEPAEPAAADTVK